ncbi:GNAT family N-acetyltransferase [soil metagenome]
MVDPATGRRIERNLGLQARDYAIDHRAVLPEWGAEVVAVGSGYAVWGSLRGAPNVSRAFALGLDGPVQPDDLARVEELYARHGDRARVVTSPWTDGSLFELLARRGYRVTGHDNILTRTLDDEPLPPPAAGVTVAPVARGRDAVNAWGRIVRVGFGMDVDDERFASADRVFEVSTTGTLYLGSVDGVPAGGSALDLRDRMATLFATSTIPALRRRGVQGALVSARLLHARGEGADLAVVLTDPGSESQRNLETHHGFRVGYTSTLFEAPPLP